MLFTELALPSHFEAALKPVSENKMAEAVICGPDTSRYVDAIRKAEATGYSHVCLHQVGPDQKGFFDFCERELFPGLRRASRTRSPQGPPGAQATQRRRTA